MKKEDKKKYEMIEGFSMRDCLSQDVIDKMYVLSKKGKSNKNKNNK